MLQHKVGSRDLAHWVEKTFKLTPISLIQPNNFVMFAGACKFLKFKQFHCRAKHCLHKYNGFLDFMKCIPLHSFLKSILLHGYVKHCVGFAVEAAFN